MNQTVKVNVSENSPLELYSSLEFNEERGTSRIRPGHTVVLEELENFIKILKEIFTKFFAFVRTKETITHLKDY